jgi:glutathione S-transferase
MPPMSLTLHYHPLASFCWKPLIALHESGTAFDGVIVDLFSATYRAAFAAVWPFLKFPVLVDHARDATVAESSTIIDYLDAFHGGALVPADPDRAWRARMWDRVFDGYVQLPTQKVVLDTLRPQNQRDPAGVAEARAALRDAWRHLGATFAPDPWALGAEFTLADCAAAPALFYGSLVEPFGPEHGMLRAYLGRLMRRPSFARVLADAEPWFGYFPLDPKPSRLPPDEE